MPTPMPSSLICSEPPREPTGTDQGLPSVLGARRSRKWVQMGKRRVHWRSTLTDPLGAPLTTENFLRNAQTVLPLRASGCERILCSQPQEPVSGCRHPKATFPLPPSLVQSQCASHSPGHGNRAVSKRADCPILPQ